MKNNRATITGRGQVTLPIEIRQRMGLRDGDLVEFKLEQGVGTFTRYTPTGNRFQRWAGVLGNFDSLEQALNWQRSIRGVK